MRMPGSFGTAVLRASNHLTASSCLPMMYRMSSIWYMTSVDSGIIELTFLKTSYASCRFPRLLLANPRLYKASRQSASTFTASEYIFRASS